MSAAADPRRPLLIALGHTFRCDDAAGPKVLENIRTELPDRFDLIHHNGDPSDLIDLWLDREVLVVDAAAADEMTNPIRVFDPLNSPTGPATGEVTSSHALSLAEALELGRMLDKLPRSMTVVAIAGEDFAFGDRLTPRTQQAVAAATQWIVTAFPQTEPGESACTKAP